ncbi:hypothetical protein F2P45_21805 [Massilia sp. CCM 8733]|uniref:Uncharacterized protein n=1 Tax=Massilia mucilaginosa TaxID=2609282 RepID=A0ABX0NXZ6_9BURK|nr:hypothetical protein [Massilia mucilaginosa]NHZ91621.1 hypothetical protein [Massilia mucilaginosa]
MLLASLALACHAHAATLTYPLTSDGIDSRYDYDWAVLRAALEKTVPAFGAFEQRQSAAPMSPSRVVQEMATPAGRINIFVRASSPELEMQFLPIRLPVDRGLLGYRLLLIRQSDRAHFAQVKSVADLRPLRAGVGQGWADYKGDIIGRAAMTQRRVIRLPNPRLTPPTPLSRAELWFDPLTGK